MSKIVNVRLPASATTTEYNVQNFNQLVEALKLIVNQLNTTYTPVASENSLAAKGWMAGAGAGAGGGFAGAMSGFQTSSGIMLPYGMFMSTADQTNAGITVENLVTYNLPVLERGIRVDPVNTSRLYFDYPGQYLVNVACQVTNQDNAVREFELWAKNSGTNYPYSNTRFDVPVRKSASIWGHIVANIAGIFTVQDPVNEYLEMAWWGESTLIQLESYAAGVSPTRPAIPSVILTAAFLSAES